MFKPKVPRVFLAILLLRLNYISKFRMIISRNRFTTTAAFSKVTK